MLPPHLAEALPIAVEVDLPGRGSAMVWDSGANGPAAPVFLLHGWNVDSPLNWASAWQAMSADRRVVMFDVHGHGGGVRSAQRFRFEHCAADVIAMADRLGIDRFAIAGYSMGGAIAQIVARRHPDRVVGLTLVATAASFNERRRERLKFVALRGATSSFRALPRFAKQRVFSTIAVNASRRYPDWVHDVVMQGDPVSLLEAGVGLGDFDSSTWLAELRTPTACVVTAFDTVVKPARQRALAERLGAEVFPVCGDHDMPVRDNPDFGPTMASALATVAPAATPSVVG